MENWTGEEIKKLVIDYAREYWKACKVHCIKDKNR